VGLVKLPALGDDARRLATARPSSGQQLEVGHAVLVGGQPLRARVLRPDPGRPAEERSLLT